jgi:PAS domain S-box-containing protein
MSVAEERNQPDEIEETNGDLSKGLMMVGLGASAGGLAALRQFFEKTPSDSGLAFVVILHLSPEHESNLAELLQSKTKMPVTQVNETVKVEPNHVYVIPPEKNLMMADGHIRLTERGVDIAHQVPVDLFFRTLASAYKHRAFAVVLSGAGTDGSVGVRLIKEAGGLAIAQDPVEAEYDGMPKSAIQSGAVDFILPVAAIPEKLVAIKENAQRLQLPPLEEKPVEDKTEGELREVLAILRSRTRHDFTNYKRSTLLRRLERRLQVTESENISEYLEYVRHHPEELQGLLRDLLISVTNFFRDPETFEALREKVIPRLFKGKGADDQVRVWVAGCATGEEAFTLAILLTEHADRLSNPPGIQIFATDIDEDAVVAARTSVFPDTIAADISPERLKRFFMKEGQYYRIKREIRERVLFAPHNILRDPPFSKLDLISCRNLLIYINRETQGRVLELFHFALRGEGYLFLGSSESAEGLPALFSPIDKKRRIYQCKPDGNGKPALVMPEHSRRETSRVSPPPQIILPPPGEFSVSELHFRMLESYAPPSVLINSDYEILHLSDHAGRYLRFAGGVPSQNLLKVVHPDLRLELRTLLLTAAHDSDQLHYRSVNVQFNGDSQVINIGVRPVANPNASPRFMLVFFEEDKEAKQPHTMEARSMASAPAIGASDVVWQLEEELERTKHQLHVNMEEYETSNEELRAANEELQAMNEEMRSATEELETSKEELQSVNEELTTVNNELKEKIEENSRTASDLQNLMASTEIGTFFLDRTLRIKLYTPPVEGLFNIIPSDVGRPFAHLTHKLNYPRMAEDAEGVLSDLQTIEREVSSTDGRWFIARLLPFRTMEDHISGVVITFIDITGRKRAEESLRGQNELLAISMEATRAAWGKWDWRTGLSEWSESAKKLFGFESDQDATTEEGWLKRIHPEDLPKVKEHIQQAARDHRDIRMEYRVVRPDGEILCLLSAGRIQYDENDQPLSSTGLVIDLTEHKRVEAELRQSEERLRRSIAIETVGVIYFKSDGQITEANDAFLRMSGYTRADLGKGLMRWDTMTPPEYMTASMKAIEEFETTGRTNPYEKEYIRKDGSRWWALFSASRVSPEEGVEFIIDITDRRHAEEQLRTSEERLRSVVESLKDYAIISMDTVGRIEGWNVGAERMFGYKAEEAMGSSGEIIYTPEDRKRGVFAEEMMTALHKGRAEDERWHLRKNGTRFYVSGLLSPLGDSKPTGFVKVARDLTAQRQATEGLRRAQEELDATVQERTRELHEANEALREEVEERSRVERERLRLLRRIVSTQEEERRRIARELHDQLGQRLTALRLQLEAMSRQQGKRSELRAQLEQLQEIAVQVDSDLDFLAWELRPTILDDFGLTAAITNFAREWSKHIGIKSEFHTTNLEDERLPQEVETNLYRITQEALNNVSKHAGATNVDIILEQRAGNAVLIIEDNGRGFELTSVSSKPGAKGMGLPGIRERAAIIGGTVEIESTPGEGTTIFVRVPIKPETGDLEEGE